MSCLQILKTDCVLYAIFTYTTLLHFNTISLPLILGVKNFGKKHISLKFHWNRYCFFILLIFLTRLIKWQTRNINNMRCKLTLSANRLKMHFLRWRIVKILIKSVSYATKLVSVCFIIKKLNACLRTTVSALEECHASFT